MIEGLQLFQKLQRFIALNSEPNTKAPFYALATSMQDWLDKAEIADEEKGEIILELFTELRESNKIEIASFLERRRAMEEVKSATIH